MVLLYHSNTTTTEVGTIFLCDLTIFWSLVSGPGFWTTLSAIFLFSSRGQQKTEWQVVKVHFLWWQLSGRQVRNGWGGVGWVSQWLSHSESHMVYLYLCKLTTECFPFLWTVEMQKINFCPIVNSFWRCQWYKCKHLGIKLAPNKGSFIRLVNYTLYIVGSSSKLNVKQGLM